MDRAARCREHGQARQGRAACRRRAARPSGRVRQRPGLCRHRERSRCARRSEACRARGGGPSSAAAQHADRRARCGVLPMGVRDGGRRRGARDQPVRRAQRGGGEGENQSAARHVRVEPPAAGSDPDGVVCRTSAFSRQASPAAHRPRSSAQRSRRSRPATTWRSSRTSPPRATSKSRSARYGRPSARSITWPAPLASGPRYLHSTGQYHKGGPNTALAFVVTTDDETSTEIPEAGYSFAVLKQAQALGDAETLAAHGRRVVRLHLAAGTTIARAGGRVRRGATLASRESFPDASSTSLCRLFPCASMVTMAGKSTDVEVPHRFRRPELHQRDTVDALGCSAHRTAPRRRSRSGRPPLTPRARQASSLPCRPCP